MDREGTALDPEVVTYQHAEIREGSLSSTGRALVALFGTCDCSRRRSIDPGRIVPTIAPSRIDSSTSRCVGDCEYYNGRWDVLCIEVWTELNRRHPIISGTRTG